MSSSPERPLSKTVTTYANRTKKKPLNSQNTSDDDVQASPGSSTSKRNVPLKPPSTMVKKNTFKEPELPKKPSSTVTKSPSLTDILKQEAANRASPASRKPPSVRSSKPASKVRQPLPSPSRSVRGRDVPTEDGTEDIDDAASIAESFASRALRRTEAERIEYFRNQPECDKETLEPHRAKCLRCGKNVSLGKKQTYTVKPWENHRAKCDQIVPSSTVDDAKSEAGQSVATTSAPRRTEAGRKAILEGDPRAEEVRPDEAQCRRCKKWIKLSKSQKYALTPWNKHQMLCSDVKPSSRIASAERKLRLVNDNQAKEFGPRHVQCGACNTEVILDGPGEFNLAKWEEHKSQCTPESPAQSPLGNPSPQSPSRKRPLEEPEMPKEDPDARPANRPKKSRGTLEWLKWPLKPFMKGFRKSMGIPEPEQL